MIFPRNRRWLSWANSLRRMKAHKPSEFGKGVNRVMDKVVDKLIGKRKRVGHTMAKDEPTALGRSRSVGSNAAPKLWLMSVIIHTPYW